MMQSKQKSKILFLCDVTISDMHGNKKLNAIIAELFIRGRKTNVPLVFITQFYLALSKAIRLNSTHYFDVTILFWDLAFMLNSLIITCFYRIWWKFIFLHSHIDIFYVVMWKHKIKK